MNQQGLELLANSAVNFQRANEIFALLEAQAIGINEIALAPPGSPNELDSRLINGVGTGDFATHDNEIAVYFEGAWLFAQPVHGQRLYIQNQRNNFIYDDIDGGWFNVNRIITLVEAPNIELDLARGSTFNLTLTGNSTLDNPLNFYSTFYDYDGYKFELLLTQDATGGRVLTFDSLYSNVPSYSTTANGTVSFAFICLTQVNIIGLLRRYNGVEL